MRKNLLCGNNCLIREFILTLSGLLSLANFVPSHGMGSDSRDDDK